MNALRSQFCRARYIVTVGAIILAGAVTGEPFIPTDDGAILERLRAVPFDPVTRELRQLRSRLSADGGNISLAVQLASRSLERCRAEGDPRYLGHAQSALARWWDLEKPPVEVLVLRATIRQSRHEFTAALADLDEALRVAPNDAQAWLTRATVLTVLGRYDEARRSCLPLARLASELVTMTAGASVASLCGQADLSCRRLRETLDRTAAANPAERLWALTILAETSARLGRPADAEKYFREALALEQRDVYLLAAFADFLLDEKRPKEVVALLKDDTQVDALLLRLALAEANLHPGSATLRAHVSLLQARFDATRLRGERAHQREESRFTMHLLRRPAEALRLAQENWEVQREPADVRIFLEAACAAHDFSAAVPCLAFVKDHGLEDIQVARLAAQLDQGGIR